jgi:hypothetical protein
LEGDEGTDGEYDMRGAAHIMTYKQLNVRDGKGVYHYRAKVLKY